MADTLHRLSEALTRRRLTKWTPIDAQNREHRRLTGMEDPVLVRQRRRIALSEPRHPTWMADRLEAVTETVKDEYQQLDLSIAWPRLWLLIPNAVRDEVRAGRSAVDQATVLAAWGLLYAALGVLWWPALLIGAVVAFTAWRQARARVSVYADLIESVVDLHYTSLAAAIVPDNEENGQQLRGERLNRRLVKSR
ncbi:hypothetical protein [Dactylosporangium cerinum]